MAETSLAELNSQHAATRASLLDSAIAKALQSPKGEAGGAPTPPKQSSGSTGATGQANPSGGAPGATAGGSRSSRSSEPQPAATDSSASGSSSGMAPSSSPETSPEANELGDDAQVAPADEPQDGTTEAPETGIDRQALDAAVKKRDLRAVERLIGLEEGALGSTNGEYAALRRRTAEADARDAEFARRVEHHNTTLNEKFGAVAQLVQLAQKGDLRAFAGLVHRTTGISIPDFIKLYAQNVERVDPKVAELERENARLRGEGKLLETKGEPQQVTQEQGLARANQYLTGELKEHNALKLKGGLDEVRQVWLASFDPAKKSWKLSPQQAADQVIENRRKAREQEQWILSGRKPAQPETRTVNRSQATQARPRKERPMTREQAIEFHASQMRNGKRRAG